MRVSYPRGRSETRWMARDEPGGGTTRARPARSAAGQRAGVAAPPVDDHEGVPGGRVDRAPAPGPRLAPAHEAGRVQRGREQPAGRERVGDRAGAVVAA